MLEKMKKDNKGFTLVELIVVIAILAILVAVLAPQYVKYIEKSRVSTDENLINEFESAVKTAATDEDFGIKNGDYILISNAKGTATTVHAETGSKLSDALNEYFGTNWSSAYLKSKNYDSTASNGTAGNEAAYTSGLYLKIAIGTNSIVTITKAAAAT